MATFIENIGVQRIDRHIMHNTVDSALDSFFGASNPVPAAAPPVFAPPPPSPMVGPLVNAAPQQVYRQPAPAQQSFVPSAAPAFNYGTDAFRLPTNFAVPSPAMPFGWTQEQFAAKMNLGAAQSAAAPVAADPIVAPAAADPAAAAAVDLGQSVVDPNASNAMTSFLPKPVASTAPDFVFEGARTAPGTPVARVDTGATAGVMRDDGTAAPRTLADREVGPAASDAFRLSDTNIGADIEAMIDYRLDSQRREIQTLQTEIQTAEDAKADTSGLEAQLKLSMERLETAKQNNLYDLADAVNGLADAAGVDPGFLTEDGKVSPGKLRDLGRIVKGGLQKHPNADYGDATAEFDEGIARLASGLREGSAAQVRIGNQIIRTFQQNMRAKTADAVLDPLINKGTILASGSVPARYEGDRAMINHNLQREGAAAHNTAADTLVTEFGFPENDRIVRNLRNTAATLETRAGVAKGREKFVVNQSDLAKHIPASTFPPGADSAAIIGRLSDDPQVTLLTQGLHADLGNPDVNPEEAFARYQVAIGRRAESIGKSTATQGFWGSRNLWGEVTQNWGNIMGAGGLALALYAPFERRESERRARKYAEEQDDKQWERQQEAWALQNQYALGQIAARGQAAAVASGGGGSVAAVSPARV